MSLQWPWALATLVAFPLLLTWRWWSRRRRRTSAVRVSSLALIRSAMPQRSRWLRRIPLALFALGLVVLSVGAARPRASVVVPSQSSAILLAMDLSSSMCSTDVSPNRLTAAKNAARDFVKAQRDGTQIGLVVFTAVAALQEAPTSDKSKLLSAIDNLRTSRGTAIGLGILTSIDAIAEINPNVPSTGVQVSASSSGSENYEPDTIVVLTDGANTQGVDPVTAAEQAAARRLRIYTIGFGTTEPASSSCTADQINGDSGSAGGRSMGGTGGGNNQQIDEEALTQVAKLTGGKYFQARNAKELNDVLQNLPSQIVLQHRFTELSVWFALAGAVLVGLAVSLTQITASQRSHRNNNRPSSGRSTHTQ